MLGGFVAAAVVFAQYWVRPRAGVCARPFPARSASADGRDGRDALQNQIDIYEGGQRTVPGVAHTQAGTGVSRGPTAGIFAVRPSSFLAQPRSPPPTPAR